MRGIIHQRGNSPRMHRMGQRGSNIQLSHRAHNGFVKGEQEVMVAAIVEYRDTMVRK